MPVRILALVLLIAATACAQQASHDFENGLPDGLQLDGDASIAGDVVHAGASALRVARGATVVIPMRETDGFGTVTLWVYDSGFQREGDAARTHAYGPVWGLQNGQGQQLVFGLIWAPYLAGNDSYGWMSTAAGGWNSRRYARSPRAEGWKQWTFTLHNETELTVTVDGREATGYDHMTGAFLSGASAIYLRGAQDLDEPLYVDDITIELGDEPLRPRTIPLPGENWQPPDAEPLALRDGLAGRHPRLFFTSDEIEGIRERCRTTHASFFAHLQGGADSYLAQMPPENAADCDDDQSMQQWGWWRLQTLAFAYIATGDERYGHKAIEWMATFAAYPHWGSGEEVDQSMGAANLLSGFACAYDWCWELMTPEQRAAFGEKLFRQLELLCHHGFLDNRAGGYWKGDHQNNHRHHRLSGLLLAALSVADEVEGGDRYLGFAAAECRAVAEALPPDGSNHEGPGYTPFGYSYVVRCFDALRHATNVDLFSTPGLSAIPWFRAHTMTPGFHDVFNFGDGGGGAYYFNHYLFRLAAEYQDAGAQALLDAMYTAEPGSFSYYPWPILWYDADLAPAPLETLERARYFDDLELACYRSSWTDPNALAVILKCGPYGGHRLNELAAGWVNVAHDHPDPNHFMLHWGGQMWATDDGYPRQNKAGANHNLILVDGNGPAHRGGGWTQPIPGMADMGVIDRFVNEPGLFWARGDASGYYGAQNVTRMNRYLIVPDDQAVILVDDLAAEAPRTWSWLLHSDAEWAEVAAGHFTLTKEGRTLHLRILTPVETTLADDVLEGRDRGTLLTANVGPAAEARVVAVMTLDEAPELALEMGDEQLVVRVRDETVRVDLERGQVAR